MYIWNVIRAWFQEHIEQMGVEETNFPMFLSSKSLEKVSTYNLAMGHTPRYCVQIGANTK